MIIIRLHLFMMLVKGVEETFKYKLLRIIFHLGMMHYYGKLELFYSLVNDM